MEAKKAIAKLDRAEKAGVRIVVDATEWFTTRADLGKAEREFPLDLDVSPGKCELVAEGRRIADMLVTRRQPTEAVFRHSEKKLADALGRIVAYVERKGNADAVNAGNVEQGSEQPAGDGIAAADTLPPRVDGRGKAAAGGGSGGGAEG